MLKPSGLEEVTALLKLLTVVIPLLLLPPWRLMPNITDPIAIVLILNKSKQVSVPVGLKEAGRMAVKWLQIRSTDLIELANC
jgi:hypothetical protein